MQKERRSRFAGGPLEFGPCGDENYVRYAKIQALDGITPILVPYHDPDEPISKLYQYYYSVTTDKTPIVFLKMERDNQPKQEMPIGFYTQNYSADEFLFRTTRDDERQIFEECFQMGDHAFFNININDTKGNIITLNNVQWVESIFSMKCLYNEILCEEKDEKASKQDIKKKAKMQELYFNGKLCDEDKNLKFYQIMPNNTLSVVEKVNNLDSVIFVQYSNQENPEKEEVIPINVRKNPTIKQIKAEVQKATKIEPADQTLIYTGQTLEDSKSITDYQIRYGASITLASVNPSQPNKNKVVMYLYLKHNMQLKLKYECEKNKTVEELIKNYGGNSFKEVSSTCCLLYSELLLNPKDKISKVENSHSFRPGQNFEVRVIKSGQKVIYSRLFTSN